MSKIKVTDATNLQLDWLVAKCEGYNTFTDRFGLQTDFTDKGWKPSTDWAQGGPIIEREKIMVNWNYGGDGWACNLRRLGTSGGMHLASTPLIASMRCYVASKLGDEVEVPKELT